MASLGSPFVGAAISEARGRRSDRALKERQVGQGDRQLGLQEQRLGLAEEQMQFQQDQATVQKASDLLAAEDKNIAKGVELVRGFFEQVKNIPAGSTLLKDPAFIAGPQKIIGNLRASGEKGARVAQLLEAEVKAAFQGKPDTTFKVLDDTALTTLGITPVEGVIFQQNPTTNEIKVVSPKGPTKVFTPAINERGEMVFATKEQLAGGKFRPVPPAALVNINTAEAPPPQLDAQGNVVAGPAPAPSPLAQAAPAIAPPAQLATDTAVSVPGPAQPIGLFPGLTAKQQLDAKTQVDALISNIGIVDKVLVEIEKDPSNFGLIGSAKRALQGATGVGADLGVVLDNVTGMNISDVAAEFAQRFAEEGADELTPFFDPTLSKIELWENTLAMQLAKLGLSKGDDSIRALSTALNDAKNNVRLTGLTFSKDVKERLTQVRGLFQEALDDSTKALSGQEPVGDIDAQVNSILGL